LTLIECIPNFSEGRRAEVIAALVAAVRSAAVHLLDVSSDADHNRTVITFAGEPDAVVEAAFRSIQTAARLIDLEQHRGEHPRIGAADVVPFVPLQNATLSDCVALAHRLGARVGAELGLPVYYYEAAALRPERVNLADVRRGGYEVLKQALPADPARLPDAGPARVGTAGAVAIGARLPLIAFNIMLDTADVEIGHAIAVAVRSSSGGLPYVKALGLQVNGRAQVSMNVIDYRRTSLYTIMESVRAEAARHGVTVAGSEIVGLVPRAALIDTALAYLGLPPEAATLILEDRLGAHTGDYRNLIFE
jgi:glutamate formiminotransferase